MKRIGIMGGTFDPIHNGHLSLGLCAYEEYDLDEVWFMPSRKPPHKSDHRITDTSERCDMTKLAVAPYPYFKYSDFEIRRDGTTYTAVTLELLHKQYPDTKFYFLLGADSLYELEHWYRPESVMSQCTLLVAGRDTDSYTRPLSEQKQYLEETYNASIMWLHLPIIELSSTHIREMTAAGLSITGMVPDAVEDYIEDLHLYKKV